MIHLSSVAPGTQLALTPGGPRKLADAALEWPASSLIMDGDLAYVAAGDEGMLILKYAADAPPRLLAQSKGRGKITHVALHEGYAYLADSAGALLVVDVREPQSAHQVASYLLARPLDALCVEQGRAYLSSGKHLNILDVSSPTRPRQLADFTMSAQASAVQAADGYAYLAQSQAGLGVLDVRDPARIKEAARFRGDVRDVAVAQGRAYLANAATGLTLLDVSSPQKPQWLGSANHIGVSLELSYHDGYVALRNDRSEITLVDVRNPKLPKTLATRPMENPLNAIALWHQRVLVGADSGIEALDFSAPIPNVVNIGANFGGSRRAVIRDNILYVADWFSGLHLYDISEPDSPRHLSNYHTQGSSKGVLVRGDYAFVADDDHGVQILNVSDAKHPRKVSEVATPGLAYTMKLAGDYLYLADHRGGFHIISVADVAHPAIVGRAATAGKAWAVEVVGNLAYVAADSAGLLVFDISNPRAPKQLAAYDVGGAAEDVVIRGHLAYVASFDNGLHILDISQPLQASEIGHLATPGNARGIELDGDYAYIADWVSGIQVVDIADPARPVTAGAFDTDGWSWGVRVQGSYAYVLDWWGGIAVLNVADPASPVLAGAYHARGLTRDVVVRDSYAYVADGKNGLQVFDVKNSLNPIWMASVDMPGDAQSIWLEGKTAYIATGEAGLVAVDVSNPFEPGIIRQYATPSDLVAVQGNILYAANRHYGVTVINASSGQRMAQYLADVTDMWPVGSRVLLATEGNAVVAEMRDPANPYMAQRLPQHADLVRMQDNLLALYDKATGIALYDYTTLKLLGRFNPGEDISDMEISGKRLYVSGRQSGLLVLDISNPRLPQAKAAYPATTRATNLSVYSGSVFITGNETLAGVRLLPDAAIKRGKQGDVSVRMPGDMPLGSYDLLELDAVSGKSTVHGDVLRIAMPPSKKSHFTLQDLDREMRKRGLTPTQGH